MSIELKEIKKSFLQAGHVIHVLRGLNAVIATGESVAIVGQSGSGKSTLLTLLAGLDRADSGQLLVEGQDLGLLDENAMTKFRARHIGIVFQQFHLMSHLTALENVSLPLEILGESNVEGKAKEMLEMMGLGHRLDHLPSKLSGGECQRVAIARALVVKPKVLLADEPSGNLDVETGSKVMDVFFDVVKKTNTTTILVTHSESLAKKCDRTLVLRNGLL